jgi:hypothetical protein
MNNQDINKNLINIFPIKSIRDGLHYYQIYISRYICYFKYKIYDDTKMIDCGEINKKSETNTYKSIICFEYEPENNYFIKIKYKIFKNDTTFYGHKFLLAFQNDDDDNPTVNNDDNIKINVQKEPAAKEPAAKEPVKKKINLILSSYETILQKEPLQKDVEEESEEEEESDVENNEDGFSFSNGCSEDEKELTIFKSKYNV